MITADQIRSLNPTMAAIAIVGPRPLHRAGWRVLEACLSTGGVYAPGHQATIRALIRRGYLDQIPGRGYPAGQLSVRSIEALSAFVARSDGGQL